MRKGLFWPSVSEALAPDWVTYCFWVCDTTVHHGGEQIAEQVAFLRAAGAQREREKALRDLTSCH